MCKKPRKDKNSVRLESEVFASFLHQRGLHVAVDDYMCITINET